MSFYTIGSHTERADEQKVMAERLSLIGSIDTWYRKQGLRHFPLPMLALDGLARVSHFDTAIRVEGLLPSEQRERHLIQGDWTAQVDIRTGQEHGEGDVYMGNGNTPSETKGFIFETPVPFIPEFVLGYVRDPADYSVLRERAYDGVNTYLIYADEAELEELGRVHRPDR